MSFETLLQTIPNRAEEIVTDRHIVMYPLVCILQLTSK